ncbi:MAG TPA: phenylalanine--tRNA ligase beta subunit-related protein [Ktedonobacteraceae bacterium]|nr:phenylalanine--tRNA ligase beta subunit-related protein [Ktedonobacteraceae bacterium]
MNVFQYSPAILARYPGVVGGAIFVQGILNGPTPESLQAQFQAEQQATLQHIGNTPLSQIPSLAAWRSAFRGFGVDPTQYRSAAEALLRRLTKKSDIPSINALVDIGNLVSIRYALPVAVFDTRAVHGTVTVHFADGSERYTTLGQDEIGHPEPGEVVFSDETGLVIARRWCWRQSETSAAQLDTTTALITVEAHHADGNKDIRAALRDLYTLLHSFADDRGKYLSGLLDANNPALVGEPLSTAIE